MTLERQTPPDNRDVLARKAVELFTSRFSIEGEENIRALEHILAQNPSSRPIISAAHVSNLDAPAALHALGRRFDLQIAVDAWHFGLTPQHLLYSYAGKEHFSPVGGETMFDPAQLDSIARMSNEHNRIPWIAIHPYAPEGEMLTGRIGTVYLAHKLTRPDGYAYVLPTALELRGGSGKALNGPLEMAQAAWDKSEGVYRVGKPLGLEPLDISIIDTAFRKKAAGEPVSPEEKSSFRDVASKLKRQAQEVSLAIAELLPEEQRGPYRTTTAPVSTP